MKQRIENYVFSTKLGHFLALIIISVLLELIVLFISPKWFEGMFWGSFFTGLFIAIFDKNKRWV